MGIEVGQGHDHGHAPDSETRQPTHDLRVAAVLAVLRGADSTTVAGVYGVDVLVLDRWVSDFVAAGTAQVTNRPLPGAAAQRDRFLAAFLHEMRRPLSVALGWASMLVGDEVPAAQAGVGLARVHTALSELTAKIQDVELLVTSSLGRIRLSPKPVAVGDLTSVLAGCSHVGSADGRGADLQIYVDPVHFRRALQDVWREAHRYPQPAAVQLEVVPVEQWVELRVVREGAPIPIPVLEALMEPFDHNSDTTGVTLGLYLARALLVSHGGMLGIEQDDHSTVFWMRVPRRPLERPAGA